MKKILYILISLCFVQLIQAQENSEYRIIRSNLGSSGSSQYVGKHRALEIKAGGIH